MKFFFIENGISMDFASTCYSPTQRWSLRSILRQANARKRSLACEKKQRNEIFYEIGKNFNRIK